MRANSRSSSRWRVAIAVVALGLCALPKAALGDGGGNGRLVAARLSEPNADGAATDRDKGQPVSEMADTGANPKIEIDQKLSDADDGDGIGDDSDVASVEGSVNDTVDTGGERLGETF
jgi:hypothetical protein